jgi:nitroimidazol reductase NimA-like FMN-containing flavoprotein (pyridoxamine 5'-phosphate oxidase superfamily)
MTPAMRKRILNIMKGHRIMTLATVRPDGYPQATTVTYANDGLTLYFGCDLSSQKVRNIKRNSKVSLTIDHDEKNWGRIRGLSLGGRAQVVKHGGEDFDRGLKLMTRRFPQLAELSDDDMKEFAVVKVAPKVISLLDYTKGFGHTDLVKV